MKKGRINECNSPATAETMPARSSSSCSSPADKVASIDDLLTGILLRLPVRSLLRFKSVSKHWYFLITSPSFNLLRSRNPDPPLGLFVQIRTNKPYLEYEFVSLDIENPVKAPFTVLNFDPNVIISIGHSSNGLMVCSNVLEAVRNMHRYKYYVFNPTINQFITLPRSGDYDSSVRSCMTIAFDPLKSSDYRIIYVYAVGKYFGAEEINYQIEIFSSTTRTWKPSCQFSYHKSICLDFKGGIYWNNAIHWIQDEGFILYFKLDEESIHEKPTPLRLRGLYADSNRIFESRDQLLIVEIHGPLTSKLKIHELKRDYSAWSLKYNVDLEKVGKSFPEIRHPNDATKFRFDLLSIVLGEKEEDSFLVLEVPGKALRFNIVTKTFYKLHDFSASLYPRRFGVFTGMPNVYPFVESLYSF